MTQILVPVPKTPVIDLQTGYMTREWYRYFSLLQQAVGGTTDTNIDVLILSGAEPVPFTSDVNTLAEQADSFGSQNAGRIEELSARESALNPQFPGPQDITALERGLTSQMPFGMPPTELGSLEAAKNIGYRILAAGHADLVAGTATVNSLFANSANEFSLTAKVVAGIQGVLSVGTITAGTNFVINSSNPADTSTVSWVILGAIRG